MEKVTAKKIDLIPVTGLEEFEIVLEPTLPLFLDRLGRCIVGDVYIWMKKIQRALIYLGSNP